MIQGSRNAKALWVTILAVFAVGAGMLMGKGSGIISADAALPPILLIDAGHGGEDGGAIAPDGMLEADINWDIALRLEALAHFWGVETRRTRPDSSIDYPASAQTLSAKKKADQNARLVFINDTPGGVLISIHQNNYPAASPHGIQVFYSAEPESDTLASAMQENLTAQLCPDNRRVAELIDDGIYLINNARCPAVLVECGFLSNPEELAKLETETYRTELAAVMLASYRQYTRGIKT